MFTNYVVIICCYWLCLTDVTEYWLSGPVFITALHGRPLNLQTMVFSLPWHLTVVPPPRDCNPTSQGIDPCLSAVQKTKLLSAIYRSSAGNLSNETISERQLMPPTRTQVLWEGRLFRKRGFCSRWSVWRCFWMHFPRPI